MARWWAATGAADGSFHDTNAAHAPVSDGQAGGVCDRGRQMGGGAANVRVRLRRPREWFPDERAWGPIQKNRLKGGEHDGSDRLQEDSQVQATANQERRSTGIIVGRVRKQ